MNARKAGPAEFVVLSFERPEGERFALFRSSDWLRASPTSAWGSPVTAVEAMKRFVDGLELLSEDEMRARLHETGLAGEAVTGHIVKARNIREMNSKGGSWEVVTVVGYRNDEGQEVVAKTTRTGSEPEQRVFVMRCSVCGHRYGTYGSEIPHRCCPQCQDGPPGLLV